MDDMIVKKEALVKFISDLERILTEIAENDKKIEVFLENMNQLGWADKLYKNLKEKTDAYKENFKPISKRFELYKEIKHGELKAFNAMAELIIPSNN